MGTKFLNVCAALGIVVLVVYVLAEGRDILLPFVVALAVWYLIISLKDAITGLRRFGLRLPYGTAMLISVLICVLALWAVFELINANINEIIAAAPRYQTRFIELIGSASKLLGIEKENPLDALVSRINLADLFSQLAGALTSLATDLGLIVIYVLFLLLENRTFKRKIEAMARDTEQHAQWRVSFEEIGNDIKRYMRIKTTMSLITGVLSYIVLKIVGVDFAEFWAILIFILNYIPTIGAILGALFPALLMAVQFDSPTLIVVISILLIAIPVSINNIVEPRIMGQSLNVSSLVIILSLVLWGAIWGVIGMFLCVPITVIMMIILSKFPATRPVAIMLSANGDLQRRPPPERPSLVRSKASTKTAAAKPEKPAEQPGKPKPKSKPAE